MELSTIDMRFLGGILLDYLPGIISHKVFLILGQISLIKIIIFLQF